MAAASCSGDPKKRQVRDALAVAFPDGLQRCLSLPAAIVGNHVSRPGNAVLWYPATGPTAPDRHMFVFWAAREAEPVPTLVAELAKAGAVRRSVVEANTDVARQWLGPEVRDAMGFVEHPTQYGHDRASFKVAIYETPSYSPDFQYAYDRAGGAVAAFPSRVYDGPLPPPDQSYVIPLTTPYAVDLASGACLRETLDEVVSVETKPFWTGTPYVEAKVTFKPTAPAWMGTPAFREAALGPDTPSITAARSATLIFRIDGDKLVYVREDRP